MHITCSTGLKLTLAGNTPHTFDGKKPHPRTEDKMITLIQIIPADGVRLFGQMVKKEIDLSDRGVGDISPLWS